MGYVDLLYPFIGLLVLLAFSGLGVLVLRVIQERELKKNPPKEEIPEEPFKEYFCPFCAFDISLGVNALVKKYAYGGLKKLVLCPRCSAKITVDLNVVGTNLILREPGRENWNDPADSSTDDSGEGRGDGL